ncbi:MAG: hypothetical protein QM723_13015 [Myxococcaceae bacterium]
MHSRWFICCASAALLACGSTGGRDASVEPEFDAGPMPPGCEVVAPTSCPSPAPTYADVQPVFTSVCVTCHNWSNQGQWPLDSYEHVADWADQIRGDLLTCAMPPADGGVVLAPTDRDKVLLWIRCGTPE